MKDILHNKFIIIGAIIAFVLIIVLIVTHDSKEYIKLGDEITIKKQETINIDKKTTLKFTSSSDSRCPASAQCIWEGQIEYTFEYKTKKKTEKIVLGTVKDTEKEIDNYVIRVKGGEPNKAIIKIEEKK